jgi:hypothetical protein
MEQCPPHVEEEEEFEMKATTADALGFSMALVGGHTARSMMLTEMRILNSALSVNATEREIATAVVDENLLQKPTLSSRKKSLRHLVELYGMDPTRALFRILWQLGHDDLESLPQLCLVCAYARDPQLRQSFESVRWLRLGAVLERIAMEQHLETAFPGRFSPAMKKSMAQNVNTTWTVAGHLSGKAKKIRQLPEARPVSAAYAMLVGYLNGFRGEQLMSSPYAFLVSSSRAQLESSLSLASAKGLLSFKKAAGIVEFDFSHLLTSVELELIHESD